MKTKSLFAPAVAGPMAAKAHALAGPEVNAAPVQLIVAGAHAPAK